MYCMRLLLLLCFRCNLCARARGRPCVRAYECVSACTCECSTEQVKCDSLCNGPGNLMLYEYGSKVASGVIEL